MFEDLETLYVVQSTPFIIQAKLILASPGDASDTVAFILIISVDPKIFKGCRFEITNKDPVKSSVLKF